MPCIYYDDTYFRSVSPAFESRAMYPASIIQVWWDQATNYVTNQYGGCYFWGANYNLSQQKLAVNLMAAHLLYISNLVTTGQTPGVVTNATIDKVSVALLPPPQSNNWQYWLNQSPYGQQLMALLQVAGVGGFYYSGGRPALPAFRR